ncbi:hypothetical protein [Pelosinus sp. sgz500959]|uniref:hypothetical protein n=1 Tax=Pelosinus sp. sgz500959 TaxID=3242472 RepID=UPI0036707D17
MFSILDYRDSMIIFRGLLILTVFILIGVGVAERQLNGLTQRQENVLAFSIAYDPSGIYTIYISGSAYQLSALYPVGEIINNDRNVTLKTTQHRIVIPKYIELDCRKELMLLELYIKQIQEKINVYDKAFR